MDKGTKDIQCVYINKRRKGGNNMSAALKIKPIVATPAVKGKYADEVIKEAMRKPSANAMKRNEEASKLLAKLRG